MRKSLGDKRKEIAPEQIDEITRLYGDYEEGPNVRILPNEAFGFNRLTVERPLRLVWRGGPDAAAALEGEKAYRGLVTGKGADPKAGAALQQQLSAVVTAVLPEPATDRMKAEKQLKDHLGATWTDLKAPVKKALLAALAIRQDDAPPVPGKGDSFEPDVDLRDNENVPLGEDIDAYMTREVLPYAADAWVDHDKTKTGYEIPFTRHFHVYTPPRPIEEIDAEIRELQARLQNLLSGASS
jgi:type I restriction enzyme M protein